MSRHVILTLIILPALLLSALSVTMLGSIAPDKVLVQTLFSLMAVIIGWGVYRIGSKNLFYFSRFFYVLLIVLLAFTVIFGRVTRGSARWLEIAGVRGQVSELAKPAVLLFGVLLLGHSWPRRLGEQLVHLGKFTLLMLLPIILVLLEPDLGTSIVLLVLAATLGFCSGIPRRILFLVIVAGLFAVPASRYFLADYQLRRIDAFMNPYADPRGAGYHVIQSTIAVGSGQLFGRGLGHGTQSRLKFLPERQTDFIFASLVEELGLAGGLLTLTLYAAMLTGLVLGIFTAKDRLGFLLLTGCAGWLFFQAATNIAMNMGLAPVTGITLPFLSAGGSSLISSSVMLALAASSVAKRSI